jgi:hypothetical protein
MHVFSSTIIKINTGSYVRKGSSSAALTRPTAVQCHSESAPLPCSQMLLIVLAIISTVYTSHL